MDLANKKCVPCQGGEPTLKGEDLKRYLSQLDKQWKLQSGPDKIVKEFEFSNFMEGIEFINKVAKLAEEEGHHPNIYLHSYKKVRIELWTHKINGLHENDFIMATKIDRL